eukprot:TRINITY_DN1954_c0_g7_i1.p2 TRINITY_DN1954_c0_g7~~TRINITY_DN1954_c0_g7_i1.p2  ORF type:complete len:183 (+),score=31.84 TRINITY_DN1954_c0_g7_i1:604-1152(+)
MVVEHRGRGRGAEFVDAEHVAVEADVLAPEVALPGFDGDAADFRRQHELLPRRRLLVEAPRVGHRDNAHGDPAGFEDGLRLHGDGDFRAGGDDHCLQLAVGFGEHVAAPAGTFRPARRAAVLRQVLTRQEEGGRSAVVTHALERFAPGDGCFQLVAGAPQVEAGNDAQAAGVFNRLVPCTLR